MKRSWFGVFLLAFLLIAGLLADRSIARCHDPVTRDLEDASRSILQADWHTAGDLSRQAMDHWQHCQPFRAAMGNQNSMEEVDGLFARLEVYLTTRDPQAAALCAEIARRISDLHPHGDWWDLL